MMTETDLVRLVEHAASHFRKAYGREVHARFDPDRPLRVMTDEDKVKQLLFILLDNARKYSEESITVEAGITGDDAFIRVIDRGIGIPKEELGQVFERFYRVDKARSRAIREDEGGAGLGLSLAKEIAEAIGVRIEIDSIEGVGTTVKLGIPCAGSQRILMKPE
jgi:signal transduction histidine kinase